MAFSDLTPQEQIALRLAEANQFRKNANTAPACIEKKCKADMEEFALNYELEAIYIATDNNLPKPKTNGLWQLFGF